MSSSDEWTTLSEESGTLFKFTKKGEEFIGIYEGRRHIVPQAADDEDDEFDQDLFRCNSTCSGPGDELFAYNPGYKVREALTQDHIGMLIRLTYVKDVPVNGRPDPMKDVKVEARAL